MDVLNERGETHEWLEKMNLCRMRNKILWVDELYQADGKVCKSAADMGDTLSTLVWPKTPIPDKWDIWWWEQLTDLFPQRKERVQWRHRKSTTMLTEDGSMVRYKGEIHGRLTSRGQREVYAKTGDRPIVEFTRIGKLVK